MRRAITKVLAGSKPALGAPQKSLRLRIPGPGLVPAVLLSIAGICLAQSTAPKSERELIAILRSDAPEADKALACKNLSVYGSDECVAEVAKLLANERLSSWARIALEAIP